MAVIVAGGVVILWGAAALYGGGDGDPLRWMIGIERILDE
jgi:hypothetical protein